MVLVTSVIQESSIVTEAAGYGASAAQATDAAQAAHFNVKLLHFKLVVQ